MNMCIFEDIECKEETYPKVWCDACPIYIDWKTKQIYTPDMEEQDETKKI